MQIQAYQFIKYNKQTSIEHIEKVHKSGAVVCFDFEDGIVNPLEMDRSAQLKEEARALFGSLYAVIQDLNSAVKVGVRVNNIYSSDFEKDLFTLKDKTFDSIFIPKIEGTKEHGFVIDRLNAFNIEYKNLIPIVESKKGFENLEAILQSNPQLHKIAFGHCDYNLDIDAYPFFHQNSWEYWKWITAIIKRCEKYSVQLINSPYLNLGDTSLFCAMLSYIATTKKQFCGQITLSTNQSYLCNSITLDDTGFTKNLENRNTISMDKEHALELIHAFETNNKQKGLTKCNNRIISLQEYLGSKKLINDNRIIHEMCFVGGCFPVQHTIIFEDLFHQKAKRKIEDRYKCRLNQNIIRYECLSTVLDKIKTVADSKNLDLLIFSVRPEPFLRLIKLFYKYVDTKGKQRWSFNLPYLNLLNPEKFDLLDLGRAFPTGVKKNTSYTHKLLISCNYLLGRVIGNKRYALKIYQQTTQEVIDFCNANRIKYIILGPNRRTNTYFEPAFCKNLDSTISTKIEKQNYICGYEVDNIKQMNHENGIHVTQAYHDLIAEKIYKTVVEHELLGPISDCLIHKN